MSRVRIPHRPLLLVPAALAATLGLAAAPATAATFVTGQVNANASAAIVGSFNDLPGVVNSHNGTATNEFDSRSATALADAVSTRGFDHARAEAHVSAGWNTANAGDFATTTLMTANSFDPTPDVVVQATTIDQTLERTAPAWSYTFDATGNDDLFTLDFSVTTSGNFPGLGTWFLNIKEDGTNIGPNQPLTSGADAGVFTQALVAGHRYQVSLVSNDGLTFVSDGRRSNNFQGEQTSLFDWTITGQAGGGGGVPEPATWALTLLGFGLAGGALRRRRGLPA